MTRTTAAGDPGSRERRAGRAIGTAALAALVILVVVPLLPGTSNSTLLTLTLMLTGIGVAVNWNLTGGFTGYVDFGHAVWFGIGAYGTAILMSLQSNGPQVGWPPVPAIVVGAWWRGPWRRSSAGHHAAEGAVLLDRHARHVRGRPGDRPGLEPSDRRRGGPDAAAVSEQGALLLPGAGLVVLLVAFTWWLRRTRFGAALVAIREDEVGAETRGIDTTRFKTAIFSFAGLSTGLFGALWAYQNTFVDPDIAFVEVRTIDAVMGTMLGGLGTVAGPILGAAALYWLREVLWAHLLDYHLLTQGVLLILIVLFVPRGLVGLVDRRGTSLTELWGLGRRRRRRGVAAGRGPERAGASQAGGPAPARDAGDPGSVPDAGDAEPEARS